MFDFDLAVQQAAQLTQSSALEAIVLGPSGAGKSYLMGTFGCPVLYLYSTGESHGPKAAQAAAAKRKDGTKVIPICMDFGVPGPGEAPRMLTAEETLQRVLDALSQGEKLKEMGIGAIVIDGAAELEIYIRDTQLFRDECKTHTGKHNAFQEPAATTKLFRPIINALKDLQRNYGMHFAITCMLDVKELGPNREILEAAPRLKGFSVAEMLIQQFGDVLVVGPMTKNKETKHKFQFMTDIVKASTDEAGRTKRAMNFNPRLSGCAVPPYVDADMKALIELKKKVE